MSTSAMTHPQTVATLRELLVELQGLREDMVALGLLAPLAPAPPHLHVVADDWTPRRENVREDA